MNRPGDHRVQRAVTRPATAPRPHTPSHCRFFERVRLNIEPYRAITYDTIWIERRPNA